MGTKIDQGVPVKDGGRKKYRLDRLGGKNEAVRSLMLGRREVVIRFVAVGQKGFP